MIHSFDIEVAKKYGITEAILLNNINFWIEKNKANEINFYDGYYWTFNSKKAFSELFPYLLIPPYLILNSRLILASTDNVS